MSSTSFFCFTYRWGDIKQRDRNCHTLKVVITVHYMTWIRSNFSPHNHPTSDAPADKYFEPTYYLILFICTSYGVCCINASLWKPINTEYDSNEKKWIHNGYNKMNRRKCTIGKFHMCAVMTTYNNVDMLSDHIYIYLTFYHIEQMW